MLYRAKETIIVEYDSSAWSSACLYADTSACRRDGIRRGTFLAVYTHTMMRPIFLHL